MRLSHHVRPSFLLESRASFLVQLLHDSEFLYLVSNFDATYFPVIRFQELLICDI